jgi:hypothetical protein
MIREQAYNDSNCLIRVTVISFIGRVKKVKLMGAIVSTLLMAFSMAVEVA